jgi:RNA polymerase sigma-70 factor, ECF subfamily
MRDELESQIRRYFDQGELNMAATTAMKGYGPEIFRFLSALHRAGDEADEVFSIFAENLWKNIAGFSWQSSFRTWAYSVARYTSARYRRDEYRRQRRQQALPENSDMINVVAQIRTTTAPFLRTENMNRLAALRSSLSTDDQELLILRVDRKLSWMELADVLHDPTEAPLPPEQHKREAARLRKRFQLVKDRLHDMARREGLIDVEGDAS